MVITTPRENNRQELISMTETNSSGLAGPITLAAPTTDSSGTRPGGATPYVFYSLWVEHPGYQVAHIQDVQIFPNTVSIQDIELIPLGGSSVPGSETIGGAQPQPL